MRESGSLEVGVDLLDDCVPTEDLVRGHGVEEVGVGGGEERVEAPYAEQAVLPGGGVLVGTELGDPADDQAARNPGRPWVGRRTRRSRSQRPRPGRSTDRRCRRRPCRCTRSSSTHPQRSGDRGFDSLVHPGRDRHRRASGVTRVVGRRTQSPSAPTPRRRDREPGGPGDHVGDQPLLPWGEAKARCGAAAGSAAVMPNLRDGRVEAIRALRVARSSAVEAPPDSLSWRRKSPQSQKRRTSQHLPMHMSTDRTTRTMLFSEGGLVAEFSTIAAFRSFGITR